MNICKYNYDLYFYTYNLEKKGLTMYVNNKSFGLLAKCQKWEKLSKYWKKKMDEYNERLDKEAIMDSQDGFDHGVHPMDPNVMEYWK